MEEILCEASLHRFSDGLQQLFLSLLFFDSPPNVSFLWYEFKQDMAIDIINKEELGQGKNTDIITISFLLNPFCVRNVRTPFSELFGKRSVFSSGLKIRGTFDMAKLMKSDVVSSIVERTDLSKKDANAAVDAFAETICDALSNGDSVGLIGFGTFEAKDQPLSAPIP